MENKIRFVYTKLSKYFSSRIKTSTSFRRWEIKRLRPEKETNCKRAFAIATNCTNFQVNEPTDFSSRRRVFAHGSISLLRVERNARDEWSVIVGSRPFFQIFTYDRERDLVSVSVDAVDNYGLWIWGKFSLLWFRRGTKSRSWNHTRLSSKIPKLDRSEDRFALEITSCQPQDYANSSQVPRRENT